MWSIIIGLIRTTREREVSRSTSRDKNGDVRRKIYTDITFVIFCKFHHILEKELASFRIRLKGRIRSLFVQTLDSFSFSPRVDRYN